MNSKSKSGRAEHGLKQGRKVKSLNLHLAGDEPNLGERIRRAFELAKSAGQELELTFESEPC